MSIDLETLVEELVRSGDTKPLAEVVPVAEAVELDTEEAWNDFQDSKVAYEKSFLESQHELP